jgi:hypothetical protein
MKSTSFTSAALFATLVLVLSPALGQQAPSAEAALASPAAKTFTQQELDQLAAPIALYPDALLA